MDDVYAYQAKRSNSDAAKELMARGQHKKRPSASGKEAINKEKRSSVFSSSSHDDPDHPPLIPTSAFVAHKPSGESLDKQSGLSSGHASEEYTLVKKTKDTASRRLSRSDFPVLNVDQLEEAPKKPKEQTQPEKKQEKPIEKPKLEGAQKSSFKEEEFALILDEAPPTQLNPKRSAFELNDADFPSPLDDIKDKSGPSIFKEKHEFVPKGASVIEKKPSHEQEKKKKKNKKKSTGMGGNEPVYVPVTKGKKK